MEISGFSFWVHFPDVDKTNNAEKIARRHIDFYKKYKFDFLKFSPHGLYTSEIFGGKVFYPQGKTPVTKKFALEDVGLVQSTDASVLQLHIDALKIIKREIDIPVMETIFSPLTILAKMSAGGVLQKFFAEERKMLRENLKIITNLMRDYIGILNEMDVGIFYAVQMNELPYHKFLRFDVKTVKGAKFGMLHIHGFNPNFRRFLELPLNFVSWESENIALSDIGGKIPVHGIDRDAVSKGEFKKIETDIKNLLEQREDAVIGPNCILKSESYLDKVKKIIERCRGGRTAID